MDYRGIDLFIHPESLMGDTILQDTGGETPGRSAANYSLNVCLTTSHVYLPVTAICNT